MANYDFYCATDSQVSNAIGICPGRAIVHSRGIVRGLQSATFHALQEVPKSHCKVAVQRFSVEVFFLTDALTHFWEIILHTRREADGGRIRESRRLVTTGLFS